MSGGGGGERQQEESQDPTAHLEGQGQAEKADADEGVDGVEDGLWKGALALDGEDDLIALPDLLDEDGVVLAEGRVQLLLLVTAAGVASAEHARRGGGAEVAKREARTHGVRADGAVGRAGMRGEAADDGGSGEVRRHGEDAGAAGRAEGTGGGIGVEGLALPLAEVVVVVVVVVGRGGCGKLRARGGAETEAARRWGRVVEMLAQQAGARGSGRAAVDVAPAIPDLVIVLCLVLCSLLIPLLRVGLVLRGLPMGQHEAGATWYDLCETGGALPAAGKGAEAVDTAEVGHGGQAVGDG